MLGSTDSPVHSYADDPTLHESLAFRSNPSSDILKEKRICVKSQIENDLDTILQWGSANLVSFNASKTQALTVSLKRSDCDPILMQNAVLTEHKH